MLFINDVITNAGTVVIAGGVAGGTINITRVAVGSGTSATPLTQNGLVNFQMNLSTPTIQNFNNGTITVNSVLDSASVGTTFNLTEMGVFGTLNAGAEQLIAYLQAQLPGDSIAFGSGGADVQTFISIPIQVGNVPTQSITVSMGGQVFNSPTVVGKTGITVIPITNAFSVVTEYDVYATGLLKLSANITLYVATTGNDSTALPNDVTHPWLTIQGALNYLIPYFIPPGLTATISVSAGIYAPSSPITVNHPNGQNIQIIGSVGSPISATTSSMTGTTVTLTAASGALSSILAGDYIIATNLTTSYATVAESGVFKVVTCNGTSLTYVPGGSTLGISGTYTVTRLNTLVTPSTGITAFNIIGNGVGLIQNFGLVGNTNGTSRIHGVNVSSTCLATINTVAAIGFTGLGLSFGFTSGQGGTLNATTCYANSNDSGFVSFGLGSSILCAGCLSNRNANNGYWADTSFINLSSCYAMGNSSGLNSLNSGSIQIGGSSQSLFGYNTNGLFAQGLSSVIFSAAVSIGFASNTTDIALNVLSIAWRQAGPALSWSTKSSNITAVNTLTADGSYFSP